MRSQKWRLLALGAMVLVPFSSARAQERRPPVIVVSAMAERQVPADSAVVRVAWYLLNAGAAAQEAEDSSAVDSLRALLRAAGVVDPAVRHAPAPWYMPMREDSPDWPRDRRREVSVVIVGEQSIIAALAALRNHPVFEEAGAEYGCTCSDSLQAELLREAFGRTRARASALADAAGTRLEGVFAMTTEPFGAELMRGTHSLGLSGQGLESYGVPLVPPPPPPGDGLQSPLVEVAAGVYVAWEVGRM